jgi:hypothetical protein
VVSGLAMGVFCYFGIHGAQSEVQRTRDFDILLSRHKVDTGA